MLGLNFRERFFILLVLSVLILSCNQGAESIDQTNNNHSFDTAAFLKKLPDLKEYPIEFDSKSKMISINDYFSEAQAEQFNQLDWMAFVYDSATHQYSLVRIFSGNNFEASVDVSEDGKVGYLFKEIAKEKQKTVFLFDNPWMKKEMNHIQNLVQCDMALEGGETIEFTMASKKYRLQADDKQLVVDEKQGSFDYHLFLHELSNNEISATVQLSFIPWFDDSKVKILFVGDLDGDQKPDVILDNSYKYTGSGISGILYLSSAAGGKLLKPISKEQYGELREEQMHSEGC